MIRLLLEGPKGREQFRAAVDSAQSSVELSVMGMALARAWTLAAAKSCAFLPIRFFDWDHNHRVSDLPKSERADLLLSVIAIFPRWGEAVERTAGRGGCDPVAALARLLVHADGCHENPLFNALSEALSQAPLAIARALGDYPLSANEPALNAAGSLSAQCFQRARDIARSKLERLEMSQAMAPEPEDRLPSRRARPSL